MPEQQKNITKKTYIFKIGRKEHELHIHFSRYGNSNRLALQLVKTSELFEDITENIMPFGFRCLNEDEIIVKTHGWLENIDQWLIDNDIATHTGHTIEQNWIKVPVMQLTPAFFTENKEAIASAGME